MNQLIENLQKPASHFNFERIRSYIGSDKDTMNYILNLTIEELHASLIRIEHHIHSQNLTGIKDTCHKLFGTAATIGLEQLSLIARQFESLNQLNQKLLNDLLAKMKAEVALVIQLMSQKIN